MSGSRRGATGPWEELTRAWDRAVASVPLARGGLVVLFSGGLDSGLVAWELQGRPDCALFTVGTERAPDLLRAERVSVHFRAPWTGRTADAATLARLATEIAPELEGLPRPRRSIFLGLAAAIALAPPGPLVCGQGADELFLGYAHFRGLSAAAAQTRAQADLELLVVEDLPRTARIAAHWDRTIVTPYLDAEFVRAVTAVPIEERMPGTFAKALLRGFARHRGLPPEVADAPKRAIQFGSGVDRWLRGQPAFS